MLKLHACAAALSVAGVVAAQIPSSASLLNPSGVPLKNVRAVQRGDAVHLFGYSASGQVVHARSLNGGRWYQPVEQPIGAMIPGSRFEMTPSGDLVVLGLSPEPDPTIGSGPVVAHSGDGGATWSYTDIGGMTSRALTPPKLHVDGAVVQAFWAANDKLWTNRSVDSGATWMPSAVEIPTGIAPVTPFIIAGITVFDAGAGLRVYWSHTRPQFGPPIGEALEQVSYDQGLTWLPVANVVTPNLASPVVEAVADGSDVLMWGVVDMHRSTDGGQTWAPSGPVATRIEHVSRRGQLVLVAGENYPPYRQVLFVSLDGGTTWASTLTANLTVPGLPVIPTPQTHVTDDAMFVWYPGLNVLYSTDQATTWRSIGGLVQHGFGPTDGRTIHAARTLTPSDEVYAFVGTGSAPLGTATVGSGGALPVLRGEGFAAQSGSVRFVMEDLVGGSVGVLGVSTSPPLPVSVGAMTLYPDGPLSLFGFATGGGAGVAGAGSYTETLPVPVNPAVFGLRLVSQAVVVDAAGGPLQLVSTNALETWLR